MSKTRFFILSAFLSLLTACSNNNEIKSSEERAEQYSVSMQKQLELLKERNEWPIDDLDSLTPAERLLYTMNVPQSFQSVFVIMMETQITNFEATGQTEIANELRENLATMQDILDEMIPDYVSDVAPIYEEYFTEAEILQMTELFSDPVLQKMKANELEIQQKVIPIAEEWSKEFETNYAQALEEAGAVKVDN